MPAGGTDAGLGVLADFRIHALRHVAPAADMREERAIRPRDILADLGGQQRHQTAAFHLRLHRCGGRGAGEFEDRRREIDVGGERLDVHGLETGRPAPERHRPDAAHIGRALLGAHARVEDLHSGGAAIVVHEDHQGVLGDTECFDLGHQLADIQVDVVDHAEEVLGVLAETLALVQRGVFRLCIVGSVRSVGRDISIERTLGRGLAFDPLGRLFEEFVGAVPLGLHELAVMQQSRAVIRILRHVTTATRIALADPTGAMDVHLVEAAPARLILGLVAKVPLAEDTGPITRLLQLLGQRHRAEGHALALQNRVGDSVLEFVAPSQQGAARRRTSRRDLEVGEADALAAKLVQIRGLEDRVPMRAEIAVTLIVRQDEDDVRSLGGQDGQRKHDGQDAEQGRKHA